MTPKLEHGRSIEDKLDSVRTVWDLSGHFPLWDGPDLVCFNPVCDGTDLLYRHFRFFLRAASSGSDHRFRCDVSLKCLTCSFVTPHAGVVIPERMFEWADAQSHSSKWHWRDARDHIEGCGRCNSG